MRNLPSKTSLRFMSGGSFTVKVRFPGNGSPTLTVTSDKPMFVTRYYTLKHFFPGKRVTKGNVCFHIPYYKNNKDNDFTPTPPGINFLNMVVDVRKFDTKRETPNLRREHRSPCISMEKVDDDPGKGMIQR